MRDFFFLPHNVFYLTPQKKKSSIAVVLLSCLSNCIYRKVNCVTCWSQSQ